MTSPTDTDGWNEWPPKLLRRLRRRRGHSVRSHIVPPCMLVVLVYAGLYRLIDLLFMLIWNSWQWDVTWRSRAIGHLSLVDAFMAANIMLIVYVLLSLVGFLQSRMRKRPGLWCGYACSLLILGLLQWHFCGIHKLSRNWADSFCDNSAWYRLPGIHLWMEEVHDRIDQYVREDEDASGTLPHGRSLLHYGIAVARRNADSYERLLKGAPDVDVRDDLGRTPLHYTTDVLQMDYWFRREGGGTVATKLIQYGADANAKDSEGLTPLHYAVMRYGRCNDLAELLIANGADVNLTDDLGRTPLHYAAKRHYVSPNTGDHIIPRAVLIIPRAVLPQDPGGTVPPVPPDLLKKERRVVAAPKSWYAMSLLEILLKYGADPNVRDVYGRTPLYFAQHSWSRDSATALLRKYGAS